MGKVAARSFGMQAIEWPPWRSLIPSALLRNILGFGLFQITYYAAFQAATVFTSSVTLPIWFPDSVLLCALLCTRRSWWWLLLLGTLPVRLFLSLNAEVSPLFTFTIFVNGCVKAVLVAYLLQRFLADPIRFNSLSDLVAYFLVAVIAVPVLSAFGGAASLLLLGHPYWMSFEQWFLGNAMANVIVTPVLFYWFLRPPNPRGFNAGRMLEAVMLTGGLLLSLHWAFEPDMHAGDFTEASYYLPVLFIGWAAIRFRMFGATGAVALLSVFAAGAALEGSGAFSGLPTQEAANRLQHFLLLRAAPLYLAAVLIEQTVRVGNSLRESEQRYRDVVESQPAFVCRMLYDTTLTFVNSAYCRFHGKEREQLLGLRLFELMPPNAQHAARDSVDRAIAHTEHSAWECEVEHRDGSRGWQHWVCHAIDSEGGSEGGSEGDSEGDSARELQVIGQDITDRKRAEESGRRLAHASRFAAVGELTAMVAHEINQPLTAILSNAEAGELLLKSTQPPLDDIREILADIRKDDLRADAAIRGIRALLQRREFQPGTVNVNDMVAHVLRLIAGDAMHRHIKVRRELEIDLPTVVGDAAHIEQVLVILLVNGMDAMKDTPEPARELTICTRRAADSHVEVMVRDRGHGISEKNMAQIFDSFFTTKTDGMGLGLSIARSMIAVHGGRIWAENAPDGGAVFRFTLSEVRAPPLA